MSKEVRPISSDTLPAPRSRPSLLSSRRLSLLIGVLLAVLALWLVYHAQRRYNTWQIAYASTFAWHTGLWLAWIGFSSLAGLAFGLAAWIPWPLAPIRYRWSRLLLAALAAAPIAEFTYVMGYLLPRRHTIGGWLSTISSWFGEAGPLFALSVLVGVALASGFVRRGGHPPA
jgi:hypothetical protein